MEIRMKRMVCVTLIVVMLFAFVACNCVNKAKQNQVVYVGETVEYGDLTFTFEEQDIGYYGSQNNVSCIGCIKISCLYNGQDDENISRNDFLIFADGSPTENISREGLKMQTSLTSGRSDDCWVAARTPLETEMIEFDYVNPKYSDKWGKVTFIINEIPHEILPIDNTIVGKWREVWGVGDPYTYYFDADGYGYFVHINQTVGGYDTKYFSYYRILKDTIILNWDDGRQGVFHYSVWGDTLYLDGVDYQKQ